MPRSIRLLSLVLVCTLVLSSVSAAVASPLRQGDPGSILTAARLDLESLANAHLGEGSRPPGWSDINAVDPATFAVNLRLDLENLAASLLGPDRRPAGWFGVVSSTAWAVARDIRHDLELLADSVAESGERPALWIGDAPLLSCARGLQALATWFERTNAAYNLSSFPPGPTYCAQAGDEANLFAEILISGTPPAGNLRADLNALTQQLFGADVFPQGWVGGSDSAGIRQDLDLLRTATAQVGSEVDPANWFGPALGAEWVVARANRHDLEILADAKIGPIRPTGWTNTDPLVRCPRTTQNLVMALQSDAGFTPTTSTAEPDYCRQVEIEASVYVERAVAPQAQPSGEQAAAPVTPTVPVMPRAEIAADATLTYGMSVEGVISNAAWNRIYRFDGRAGDSITVAMRAGAGSSLDPVVVLLDPLGGTIAGNDDSGDSLNSQMTVTLPGTGPYYILASRYDGENGRSAGGFTLQLNGSSPGSTLVSAGAPSSLTYGGTAQGSLSNTTWFRVYRFDAYAGDSVTVTMDDASGGNLDPYLFLLDEAENVIASDDDSGGAYNASLVTGLPQTGTYYIVATRFMLNLPGDDTTPNEGPFTLRLTGSRAPASQPGSSGAGQGGGGGGVAVAVAGGISGQATTPNAYFDPLANQYAGQIPRGTPFTALARRNAENSRMMLVQGEGFVVWIAWPWTTLTQDQYLSLPLADDVRWQLPQLLCYAAFCNQVVRSGDPLVGLTAGGTGGTGAGYAGVGAPGGNLQRVDNAHVRILFNLDRPEENYAEFRLELCSAPNTVVGCEPVLRLYEFGQLVQPIRVENGYPVYRMAYNLHDTARLESYHYYTDQLWVSHPSSNRSD